MQHSQGYVLGQSARAAHRLQIQDAYLAEMSDQLLDNLALRPHDRVVELGCGPGWFSQRILRRLGDAGVLVAVDTSADLLAEARNRLAGGGKFEPVLADISQLGPWLEGADMVVGRAVLHHIPMVELMLGRLRAALRPGARVGFLEPDFRTLLGRLAYHEAQGRVELAPLRVWAIAINQLYQVSRLSPDVGSTLGQTLETAGFGQVRTAWSECRCDRSILENMLMFYDEVGDRLQALNILTNAETEEQQRLLRTLPAESLPAVWGMWGVTGQA